MTTESSDVDEGDSIDWDEAIETLKAAETERAFQSSRRSASTTPFASATQDPSLLQARHHTYIKAGNRSPVIVTPTDEEILFLHDLIDTNRYALVNDDGQDIEDIGMNRLAKPLGQTLYQQFRQRRGSLSVTDLTSPSGWCEVQYAYFLLGKRHLKPEDRPETIVTAAGNEIKINKTIAIKHDKTLEQGTKVHAKLERELHPEQVMVQVETKADRWGLRFFNQIVKLHTLRTEGKAREIPIFGWFDDFLVMGTIDEIEKRPLSKSLSNTEAASSNKKKKESSPENEKKDDVKITKFFKTSTPTKKNAKIQKPTHGYYLVDSKTRNTRSMPNLKYSVASQYQLMLYRYLFNKHATDSIDWSKFWAHEGLSPDDILSPSFLLQIQAICLGNDLDDMSGIKRLGELAEYLRDLHLQIGELQSELELVYRWRGGGGSRRFGSANSSSSTISKSKQREMKREKNDNTPILQLEQAAAASPPVTNDAANPIVVEDSGTADKPISIDDDEMAPVAENKTDVAEDSGMSVDAPEIAVATVPTELQESTTGITSATGTDEITLNGMAVEDPTVETTTKDASKDNTTPAMFDDIWDIVNQPNLFKHEKFTPESQQVVDSSSEDGIGDEEDEELQGMIIGKREFKYNENNMLEHVRNNLSFWNGREPKGVDVDETNKCRSCEFQDGCEWLAKKAEEHMQAQRKKRQAVLNPSIA